MAKTVTLLSSYGDRGNRIPGTPSSENSTTTIEMVVTAEAQTSHVPIKLEVMIQPPIRAFNAQSSTYSRYLHWHNCPEAMPVLRTKENGGIKGVMDM